MLVMCVRCLLTDIGLQSATLRVEELRWDLSDQNCNLVHNLKIQSPARK